MISRGECPLHYMIDDGTDFMCLTDFRLCTESASMISVSDKKPGNYRANPNVSKFRFEPTPM